MVGTAFGAKVLRAALDASNVFKAGERAHVCALIIGLGKHIAICKGIGSDVEFAPSLCQSVNVGHPGPWLEAPRLVSGAVADRFGAGSAADEDGAAREPQKGVQLAGD
jgi:hypothetical protein